MSDNLKSEVMGEAKQRQMLENFVRDVVEGKIDASNLIAIYAEDFIHFTTLGDEDTDVNLIISLNSRFIIHELLSAIGVSPEYVS